MHDYQNTQGRLAEHMGVKWLCKSHNTYKINKQTLSIL